MAEKIRGTPWRAESLGTVYRDWYVYSASGYTVAKVSHMNAYGAKAHERHARLIAAAPDLLAACVACLLRGDIADDGLGDVLRAAVAKVGA